MFKSRKLSIVFPYAASGLLLMQAVVAQAGWSAYQLQAAPGLAGTGFVAPDGFRGATISYYSPDQILGDSRRFDPVTGADLGRSAWLSSGAGIVELGLSGTEFQKPNGYRNSASSRLANGQVLGITSRYSSTGADLGQIPWLYKDGVTTQLGLTGAAYQGADGSRWSNAMMGSGGQVAGTTCSYAINRSSCQGHSAWISTNGTTTTIGLQDAAYSAPGYREDRVGAINGSGQVAGVSKRFVPTNIPLSPWGNGGYSAWLYSGGATVEIGLPHSADADVAIVKMNQAGNVLGENRSSYLQENRTWLYKNGASQEVGLSGPEFVHALSNTTQNSATGLNNLGHAIGFAARDVVDGAQVWSGSAAWYFDGDTTREIGLKDGIHRNSIGFYRTEASQINDAGQIAGSSERFDPLTGKYQGWDSWFYDTATDRYFSFTLSTSSSGFATSSVDYLGEDGLVLGDYLYYKNGAEQGRRLFAFTMENGLTDLGLLIDGSLSDKNWSELAMAYGYNGSAIWGMGTQQGREQGFLLTPIVGETRVGGLLPDAIYGGPYVPPVPVPGAFWLMGSSLAGLAMLRRKAR